MSDESVLGSTCLFVIVEWANKASTHFDFMFLFKMDNLSTSDDVCKDDLSENNDADSSEFYIFSNLWFTLEGGWWLWYWNILCIMIRNLKIKSNKQL